MNSDIENEVDHSSQNDLELKIENFLDHSQSCLNHLSLLKNQLNNINRLNQEEIYLQKLNEIDRTVHDLTENVVNIEQLHTKLNEAHRSKFDHRIHFLHAEIYREMNEFQTLRETLMISSFTENNVSNDENNQNNLISNELSQQQITKNHLNDSYDLLEQDLAYLRSAFDEVAAIIKRQDELTLSKTEHLKHIVHYPIRNASSFFQKALQNRYLILASGAVLGASIGGPVGFIMGAKVGALVTLSGSAVGALSMNIMRQRAIENNESENHEAAAYSQAML